MSMRMKATSKEETDREHARVKALSHEDFLDEVNSLLSIRKVTVSCVHEAGHDLGDAEVFLIAGEEQDENMYVCDCSSCVEAGMLYST